ncbi:MAG: oxidoreductase [Rhodovulum sulfidophilum]|uniref:Oxidoreductase n=1 Tax=Rhodovulum sulfidophilum TaxID=35806 RepID=A0A2W5N0K5_RHOSU|nr:MAG: oxidoreductase [Rhodovulum sulfidophilum]
MTVLVTDSGFSPDPWAEAEFIAFEALTADPEMPGQGLAIDMPNDRDPAALAPFFDRIAMIRVAFPAMGDGRGFSIARRLRAMGYEGTLRASGPLIADQARAARRVGFDEVELPESVAARQPEELWLPRAAASYRAHVFA